METTGAGIVYASGSYVTMRVQSVYVCMYVCMYVYASGTYVTMRVQSVYVCKYVCMYVCDAGVLCMRPGRM